MKQATLFGMLAVAAIAVQSGCQTHRGDVLSEPARLPIAHLDSHAASISVADYQATRIPVADVDSKAAHIAAVDVDSYVAQPVFETPQPALPPIVDLLQ
jgi:hypothetical protein